MTEVKSYVEQLCPEGIFPIPKFNPGGGSAFPKLLDPLGGGAPGVYLPSFSTLPASDIYKRDPGSNNNNNNNNNSNNTNKILSQSSPPPLTQQSLQHSGDQLPMPGPGIGQQQQHHMYMGATNNAGASTASHNTPPPSLAGHPGYSFQSTNLFNPSFGDGAPTMDSFNYESYLNLIALCCIKCSALSYIESSRFFENGMYVLPGPEDKSYEYKCKDCSQDNGLYFKHSPKTWKEMIHSALFNLEREKKYRFAHYREVISYVNRYPQFLLSDRDKELGKMKNVVTATLSYNRKLFVSFARDSGMWSNWREGDRVFEDDRGLLTWKENTFENESKRNEPHFYRLECKACIKSTHFDTSELVGSIVIPGPLDHRYEFICHQCSPSGRPTLIHQSKSWKEVAHTALFNLEMQKKYRFSHQVEIAAYVKDHPEAFSFNREIDNIKNRLSTVLSRYKKSFTSIGRYTGLWSNWKDGDEQLKDLSLGDESDDDALSQSGDSVMSSPPHNGGGGSGKAPINKKPNNTNNNNNNNKQPSGMTTPKRRPSGQQENDNFMTSSPASHSNQATPIASRPRAITSPTTICPPFPSSPSDYMTSPLLEGPSYPVPPMSISNGLLLNSPRLSPDSSASTPLLSHSPNLFYSQSPIFHQLGGNNNLYGFSIPTSNYNNNKRIDNNINNSIIPECTLCRKNKPMMLRCRFYCSKSYCHDCLIETNPGQPLPKTAGAAQDWCCPMCLSNDTHSVGPATFTNTNLSPPPYYSGTFTTLMTSSAPQHLHHQQQQQQQHQHQSPNNNNSAPFVLYSATRQGPNATTKQSPSPKRPAEMQPDGNNGKDKRVRPSPYEQQCFQQQGAAPQQQQTHNNNGGGGDGNGMHPGYLYSNPNINIGTAQARHPLAIPPSFSPYGPVSGNSYFMQQQQQQQQQQYQLPFPGATSMGMGSYGMSSPSLPSIPQQLAPPMMHHHHNMFGNIRSLSPEMSKSTSSSSDGQHQLPESGGGGSFILGHNNNNNGNNNNNNGNNNNNNKFSVCMDT
ncbi:hypothetical protein SAMD00019534_019170 [Acytostelium subglobosum LB1]|uniref:hypothetical protein n=1 Tax=Acytostelium subglobosum LB1 TaxID=1410327 RepID=UPI000644AD17|nr:hypothetical protein SAMD00019534_019170 [Acytostelium subglobosum LB1]GAM18742.1 hypothetical protein SAMD00019534_019170 [Acytostelium subglobosum LB1]|eukprot:XP_012757962.1 hypothetical protein SAMD00019534_019170 [Acytostelium subglobosum LB1]